MLTYEIVQSIDALNAIKLITESDILMYNVPVAPFSMLNDNAKYKGCT